MKIFKPLLMIILVGLSSNLFSQTTTNTTFGKGLYNVVAADSSFSMKFALRMQSLYIGEWEVNDSTGIENGNTQFLIRRARLKFGGFAYSPKLKYKVELGLTNRDISGASTHTKGAPRVILDAVIKWNFYNNFSLWAGQTKLPGNRERVVSSANLQFVDRSKLNSNFNIDRDMGVQLRHHFKLGDSFIVKEMFSIAQGEGRNITNVNLGGYQYTSRIELLPFGKFSSKGDYVGSAIKREESPKLAIGGTYDFHDRAVKTKSNQGSYMEIDGGNGYYETDITTIFADLMFKYQGVSIMAEYAVRSSNKAKAINSDGSLTGDVVGVGSGVNIQLGYMLEKNWEIAGRYTSIDWDKDITGKENQTQYTFGISKFIVGHKLKVQTDISYLEKRNNPTNELMYRLQFDLHF